MGCCGSKKGGAPNVEHVKAALPPPAGPPPLSSSGRVPKSKRASMAASPAFYEGDDIHGSGVRRQTQIIKEVDQGMIANATASNPLTSLAERPKSSTPMETQDSVLGDLGGAKGRDYTPKRVSVAPRATKSVSVIGAPPPQMAFGDPDA